MNIPIKGRDKPIAVANVHPEGIIIRVDFDMNPAAWCELQLSEDQLQALLEQVRQAQVSSLRDLDGYEGVDGEYLSDSNTSNEDEMPF